MFPDFANDATRTSLSSRHETTFAMIKPDGLKDVGAILAQIEDHGFVIDKARMVRINEQQAANFYAEHKDRGFFP